MNPRSILLLFILPAIVTTAKADELRLIVSGKAIHREEQNLNENNRGWGFEYNFDQRGNWIPLITGVSFLDSNKQTSRYLGAGSKRRYLLGSSPGGFHIDLGVFAFVMKRYDYKNNDPFIGALPFISFGNEWVAINATYVPKIEPKMIAFTYFQLTLKIFKF